jgi:ATP-binding protein involved in chromosome partitioning
MHGSDIGKPVIISDPESAQTKSFLKISKLVAGRVSVLAAEMQEQEQYEEKQEETSDNDNLKQAENAS